jgi:ATP-binding cassette subfamily B protein
MLQPTPAFYESEDESKKAKRDLRYFFHYLTPFRKQFVQLMLGMAIGSLLQMILPFLTQAIVDNGIIF